MNLKTGDRIELDGKQTNIVSIWSAGKHRQFILDDGRTATDLDQALESNKIKLIKAAETTTWYGNDTTKKDSFKNPWRKDLNQ